MIDKHAFTCILVTKMHRIESCVHDNSKNDFDTDIGFNNMNIISKSHFCKFHRKGLISSNMR